MSELDFNRIEEEGDGSGVRMKVIGVGGAGTNMVDRLMLSNPDDIYLSVVNTDQQALSNSPVLDKRCIGKKVTGGLGAGGEREVGIEAAESDRALLESMVEDVDLLFITAGLGGGTGTGVAPVIADIATKAGVVVISFVTMPFTIERAGRANVAKVGLEKLRDVCSAVIPLPNDLLIQESAADASLLDAFAQADAWIEKAIKSIWTMMVKTGMVNLDFSQLRQAFAKKAGKTLFGLGEGKGEDAVDDAIESLKLCPLLHTPEFSKKAEHLLVNIVGGVGLGMASVQRIMDSVTDEFGKDANVVMGAVVDEGLGDTVEICVIGTSDVSGVSMFQPAAAKRATAPAKKLFEEEPVKPEQKKKARKTHDKKVKVEQHEFSFNEGDPKGEFENSEGTIFEGQDLDTPTFLRKGVKIAL
ncbi:MAG: cell division protein FtsZ [Verrucomicrobiota bacterium]